MTNILAFLKYLPMILKAGKEIVAFAKQIDKAGVRFLSPQGGRIFRARAIYLIWRISQGQDQGWRKYLKADNALAECGREVFDSGRLEALLRDNYRLNGVAIDHKDVLKHLEDMQDMSKAIKAV
jgi:hypothetical protein